MERIGEPKAQEPQDDFSSQSSDSEDSSILQSDDEEINYVAGFDSEDSSDSSIMPSDDEEVVENDTEDSGDTAFSSLSEDSSDSEQIIAVGWDREPESEESEDTAIFSQSEDSTWPLSDDEYDSETSSSVDGEQPQSNHDSSSLSVDTAELFESDDESRRIASPEVYEYPPPPVGTVLNVGFDPSVLPDLIFVSTGPDPDHDFKIFERPKFYGLPGPCFDFSDDDDDEE